ncbi:MAG: dihydrolipoamide acetyltransferase family protein [Fimbriimonadaceae bacterium]|nr:dihydrolipoamide acetyltransferase family protein [Fimbriimonadaceae bacterium]
MAVEILMPELGESVHEGTVSRWLKKVGDPIKMDEPIVEIMTDKVNTELPSPAAGVLSQILIPEGGTVKVFEVMGVIDAPGTAVAAAPRAPSADAAATPAPTPAVAEVAPVAETAPVGDGDRKFFTPVVRSMAKDNGVSDAELSTIVGTGESGRVTKRDLEAYLAAGRTATPTAVAPTAPAPVKAPEPEAVVAPTVAGPEQELVPLTGLRKVIAEAMVRSSQVPTVSTVTACDVTNMVRFREINKESFLQTYGVKLTYTPFFIKALAETLQEFPLVNAQITPDNQILKTSGVHIGIAVALGKNGDEGLIVPVIRDCHRKTLVEIARDLDEIAKKARANKLGLADVQGGTFTLTNPGTYGALFGTPMINAPQSGILGAYAISKEPVIVDDMIAIRSIMHLVLTYDHRLIDGMLAGKFLAGVRDRLQKFDFFK